MLSKKIFQVSSDEVVGKLSTFLSSFQLKNILKLVLVWSAREEQNILTPHMFTYSHANTSLGQSERARTILVIYKRCYQLYNFSFFVLNILAAWLDLFSRDPTLTSNRIFVHGFCSKFL